MIDTQRPKHYRWADIPAEPMKGTITRKIVTGEKMMIAQIFLGKGDMVPAHRHENEQIVHILSGALKLRLGEDQTEEVVVRGGEVLVIPGNVLHSAEALEDTIDVDIFAPPRADWLDGSDAYLRQG